MDHKSYEYNHCKKKGNFILENTTKIHGNVIWMWGAVSYSGNLVPNRLAIWLDSQWIQNNVTHWIIPNLMHSAGSWTPCGKGISTSAILQPSFRALPNNTSISGHDQRTLSHYVPLYPWITHIRLHGDVTPATQRSIFLQPICTSWLRARQYELTVAGLRVGTQQILTCDYST
jgi:hypothetical protein